MNVLDILSSEEVCSKLFREIRWRNGPYCPRCGSRRLKGHGNYGQGLKRYLCKSCGRTFNDKTGTPFHHSRLSLKEWFTLILLFLALHNSALSLSWLLGRSYMTVFRALRRLTLRIGGELQPVRMSGAVECDELYVTAGLKGRNNSQRIKRSGREPRCRGLKRRGRGTWDEDKPPIFILVERGGGEDYVPSSDVSGDTADKIIGRRASKGSTVYTDCFASYSGLSEAGYRHETVNHSTGEYAKGEAHVNGCENRGSLVRPWLACHRGVCKDNLRVYMMAFKICRNSRRRKPVEALEDVLAMVIFLVLLAVCWDASRALEQTPTKTVNHKIFI
jgi:transposase-like protein